MTDERQLIEKLHRIEALFARPGTEGEKAAAADAAERIRRRLGELAELDPPTEFRFSVSDGWSRRLLFALLRRYGVEPYRYRNQRRTTVMARVSRRFVEETLWPEFLEFSAVLEAHLSEVTDRIISQAVSADSRDEEVRSGPNSRADDGSSQPLARGRDPFSG
ncbi:hypothetical protein JXA88_12025 [Candidatus Fermentibacteria bacterium]|nr:hypothetical protein [Candidatus Fermentibacteria bacterium]